MRALRVLGIAEGGAHLVCVDAEGRDDGAASFTIPIDERLRAAIRGDLSRFGQLEIEMAPQLRPREIQSRIRAGATVAQVASAAGCSPDRIERYAYPVLLERTTVSERARAVRPFRGAPMGSASAANAERTLDDIVMETLTDRGQQHHAEWDAFKDERGWTVTLTWHAGRTENRAEWTFTAGPDGGTVTARNAAATDLVEPGPAPLRTVGGAAGRSGAGPISHAERADDVERDHDAARREDAGRQADRPADRDVRMTAEEHTVVSTVTDDRAAANVPGHSEESGRPSRAAKRGHRPPMPSWEDVLLGTRAAER